MKLLSQDFDIYRGAAFTFSFAPVNDDDTAVELAGANARMMLKTHPDSETVLVDLSVSNGGLVIDAEHHLIAATISSVITAGLSFSKATYDLVIELSGIPYIAYRGVFTLAKLTTTLPMTPIGGGGDGGGIGGST
jgi:hypothetical protein